MVSSALPPDRATPLIVLAAFTSDRVVQFTDGFTNKPSVLKISEAPDRTELNGVKCHVFEVRLDEKGVVARILRPGWPDRASLVSATAVFHDHD